MGRPLVYVVVENPASENRVKAVFKSEIAAQEAIDQEFNSADDYKIVKRTLFESMTD